MLLLPPPVVTIDVVVDVAIEVPVVVAVAVEVPVVVAVAVDVTVDAVERTAILPEPLISFTPDALLIVPDMV